jgi:hypothetical protein
MATLSTPKPAAHPIYSSDFFFVLFMTSLCRIPYGKIKDTLTGTQDFDPLAIDEDLHLEGRFSEGEVILDPSEVKVVVSHKLVDHVLEGFLEILDHVTF